MTRRVWTAEQVYALGVRTDLPTAASILGIGRNAAYEMVHGGRFPVPVLRMGRHHVVPVAPLLRLLDVVESGDSGPPNSADVIPGDNEEGSRGAGPLPHGCDGS